MYYESDERYNKKIKAAHLIYKDNLTQQEVAKILGISRPTLAKFLNEILEEGIVTIQINDPRNLRHLVELGSSIRRRYGLRDAIVVDASASNASDIIESIGSAAAEYLQDALHDNFKIGMTGGHTIAAMVSHLKPQRQYRGIQVAATTGGSVYTNTSYHSNTLVQRLAEILNGKAGFIFAPTYADTKQQRDMLLENSMIRSSLDLSKSVDIVFTSAGDPETSINYLPKTVLDLLSREELGQQVGAFNTILLKENGDIFSQKVSELFIGLDFESFKNIETVVLLAGGEHKHAAIKASLCGGYPNVLITDKHTALYLLNS